VDRPADALGDIKYHSIIQHLSLGVLLYDTQGVITECNDALVAIIGSSREALVGLDMFRVLRDEKWKAAVRTSLEGDTGYYEDTYQSVTADKVLVTTAKKGSTFQLPAGQSKEGARQALWDTE